jgi:hypothetical protein
MIAAQWGHYGSSATQTLQAQTSEVSGGSKDPKSSRLLLYAPGYFGATYREIGQYLTWLFMPNVIFLDRQ